mmetsp:Transcript_26314/g.81955  ORF Transcript_26314/g.81955 Transcript_26314/m.81955 type:complete len:208 (+) Transcript_26314:250-873(+)
MYSAESAVQRPSSVVSKILVLSFWIAVMMCASGGCNRMGSPPAPARGASAAGFVSGFTTPASASKYRPRMESRASSKTRSRLSCSAQRKKGDSARSQVSCRQRRTGADCAAAVRACGCTRNLMSGEAAAPSPSAASRWSSSAPGSEPAERSAAPPASTKARMSCTTARKSPKGTFFCVATVQSWSACATAPRTASASVLSPSPSRYS